LTGLNLSIIELPKKRALVATNSGQFDGWAARIKAMKDDGTFGKIRMSIE